MTIPAVSEKEAVMPGIVHAGSQFRWHEQLCRIQIRTFREIAADHGRALVGGRLPKQGGVYCFWWTGELERLRTPDCNRHIELAGPGGRLVKLHLDDEWLGIQTGFPIPLYVGKNADSIAKRVRQHLRLQDDRVTVMFEGHQKQVRPTTSCQARVGVEHLFPQVANTRDIVLDNVGLSWVELSGDEHAANRFYLEDLAIGVSCGPCSISMLSDEMMASGPGA
jgi:hypothetical protein